MIKKVFANKPSFKTVEFLPGFNIVWANRTKESTKKDSRNGLGKSTLIEIIHFCLGAKASRNKGLLVDPLKGWEFSIIIQMGAQELKVTRAVDNPNVVLIDGDVSSWPICGKVQNEEIAYSIKDWNSLLGYLIFGLELSNGDRKYQPTFRSLISYFIRRSRDAFSTPFEHYRKQLEWDKQINNAFLLGLAWENAADLQSIKERKKGLDDFKKAAKEGIVAEYVGSLGDLEAQKIRLKMQIEQETAQLQSFKVHPQYESVEKEANYLTEEIHELLNASIMDKQLLELYEKSVAEEQPPVSATLDRLYAEAGLALPEVTLRRLDEVQKFHAHIIENRQSFLSSEIDRLKRKISRRDHLIQKKTEKRATVMEVLNTHGALKEYSLLQDRHMEMVNNLNAITTKIDNLRAFESGVSNIKIAQEELLKRARQDYDERDTIRGHAIEIFNAYSERLYSAPGKLVIDVGANGFKFDVEIERSGSSGINNMKIFCYDLMLAQLWAGKRHSPQALIHDSTIFDGVDERQRAIALEMAAEESAKYGFNYICTLNSDNIPWGEFPSTFDLKKHIRIELSDANEDGCLLGVRF